MRRVTVSDLLQVLRRPSPGPALIDVRSELEHAKAAVPGFINRPILMQAERHEVGITYKQAGQEAAVARGAELVLPHRPERVAGWVREIAASATAVGVIACWRGGMRSAIACDWLREAGQMVWQLEGGYKALRQALLQLIERPPPLIVVAGLTGSGKTELLQQLSRGALDLEAAAHHRGSAFGGWLDAPQPAQTTFENALGLQLLRLAPPAGPAFVEDESRMIGQLLVPPPFLAAMAQAPRLIVEEPLERRAARIFRDYIATPLAQGYTLEQLEAKALSSLQSLARRLDHQLPALRAAITAAFAQGAAYSEHGPWISTLLTLYYDRSYLHAAKHHQDRPVLFRGDLASCQAWCEDYLKAHQHA